MTPLFERFLLCFMIFNHYFLVAQVTAITADGKQIVLYDNGFWQYADAIKPLFQYIPKITIHDQIIHHTAYSLSYDTLHHLAKWTIYELHKSQLQQSTVKRTNKFKPDPILPQYTNLDADYKNSGYDRGHLVPAADMSYSEQTMAESFYYSNISPQVPSFNRGIWKQLEEQVRQWVHENEHLIIITGAIIADTLPKIGPHQITVPYYFYKIIADITPPEHKMIGFIIPNEKTNLPLPHFAVSVDSIEQITRLDFFPCLDDLTENQLEKDVSLYIWWKDTHPQPPHHK